jgi:HD domain-containing protein
MPLAVWASELARTLLADALPRRWAHSQGVARQARTLAPILGGDADLLEAAAWLHDIGYSPALVDTGFHALDGARYLRDMAMADQPLCVLVAHHSCASLEAAMRRLDWQLEMEFARHTADLHDALTYCDMTTSPDGVVVTVEARLAEIVERYGADHLIGRFVAVAGPELRTAVRLVGSALGEERRLTG